MKDEHSPHDMARDAMDRAAGIGARELQETLHTNSGAKAVYSCALRALGDVYEKRGRLMDACARMLDDHQTSAWHHPDHILVRREDFEAMRVALMPAPPMPQPPVGVRHAAS